MHKNPDRLHEKALPFGRAVMCYPHAAADRCTFAMMVEVDPIELVRGKGEGGGLLDQYVNDRPYAASSFLSVAISRALNTAFAGRSRHRQALSDTAIPLEAMVTPLPARGQEGIVQRLFEPLGYAVTAPPHGFDAASPELGDSPYVTLRLSGTVRLRDLLTHLYVLVPVLDNAKHYYIDADEVEKLLAKGEGWLERHPERELIVNRYLKRRGRLVREALARLSEAEASEEELAPETKDAEEDALETPIRLNDRRVAVVAETLADLGAKRVVDLGCGGGRLLRALLGNRQFQEIVGVDASVHSLERAERRLRLDRMSERQRARITLLHGALTYRDRRLEGYDAAALVEVIEHLDQDRLPAFERALFEFMAPSAVAVTTPNREYNALFADMPEGALRHRDHRFEWTRPEFRSWARRVGDRHGYTVRFAAIGEEDETLGPPTQMAVFVREGAE
jgi:3' terminal RNA ribose 2'-O-methyltransferase Hen1